LIINIEKSAGKAVPIADVAVVSKGGLGQGTALAKPNRAGFVCHLRQQLPSGKKASKP
jgi:hypothetical protein